MSAWRVFSWASLSTWWCWVVNLVNTLTGFFCGVCWVHMAVTWLSVLANSLSKVTATIGTALQMCLEKMLWNCWSFIKIVLFLAYRWCLVPEWCIFFLGEFTCLNNNRVTFRHLSQRKLQRSLLYFSIYNFKGHLSIFRQLTSLITCDMLCFIFKFDWLLVCWGILIIPEEILNWFLHNYLNLWFESHSTLLISYLFEQIYETSFIE